MYCHKQTMASAAEVALRMDDQPSYWEGLNSCYLLDVRVRVLNIEE